MSARTAAIARTGRASLFLCALLACGEQKSALVTDSGDAAAAANASVTPTAKAGEGGQGAARAGTPAAGSGTPSAAMSGRDGSAAGAGAVTAGARASAAGSVSQAGQLADAGSHDAAEPDAQTPAPECGACASYAAPQISGTIGPSQLSALSGLALSRSQPEIIFAHNDHDRPEVYALDLQGQLHARLTLDNAEAQDIEDIAVGKCNDKICVYLADVGDNAAQRGEYSILRFVEPTVPSSPGNEQMTATFEQLRFRYEDGSHNAESLMVAPNGNLYIITKLAPGSGGSVEATGPSSVYRLEASAFGQSSVVEALKVATLSVPQPGELALSGAAAHPCGLAVLARTYDRVYEFPVPPGADFEAAFTATPKIVAMPNEPQSEGIDYRADGRGFVTSGEGASAPLMLTQCAP